MPKFAIGPTRDVLACLPEDEVIDHATRALHEYFTLVERSHQVAAVLLAVDEDQGAGYLIHVLWAPRLDSSDPGYEHLRGLGSDLQRRLGHTMDVTLTYLSGSTSEAELEKDCERQSFRYAWVYKDAVAA